MEVISYQKKVVAGYASLQSALQRAVNELTTAKDIGMEFTKSHTETIRIKDNEIAELKENKADQARRLQEAINKHDMIAHWQRKANDAERKCVEKNEKYEHKLDAMKKTLEEKEQTIQSMKKKTNKKPSRLQPLPHDLTKIRQDNESLKKANESLKINLIDKIKMVNFLYEKVKDVDGIVAKRELVFNNEMSVLKTDKNKLKKLVTSLRKRCKTSGEVQSQIQSETKGQEVKMGVLQSKPNVQVKPVILQSKPNVHEKNPKVLQTIPEDENLGVVESEPDAQKVKPDGVESRIHEILLPVQQEVCDEISTPNIAQANRTYEDNEMQFDEEFKYSEPAINIIVDKNINIKGLLKKPNSAQVKTEAKKSVSFNNIVDYTLINDENTVSDGDYADVLKRPQEKYVIPKVSILEMSRDQSELNEVKRHFRLPKLDMHTCAGEERITAADIFDKPYAAEFDEDDMEQGDINDAIDSILNF